MAQEAKARLNDYQKHLLDIRLRKHRERVAKTKFLKKIIERDGTKQPP